MNSFDVWYTLIFFDRTLITLIRYISFYYTLDKKENQYSRASHNVDFGDKKNQCISKTVYYGLL